MTPHTGALGNLALGSTRHQTVNRPVTPEIWSWRCCLRGPSSAIACCMHPGAHYARRNTTVYTRRYCTFSDTDCSTSYVKRLHGSPDPFDNRHAAKQVSTARQRSSLPQLMHTATIPHPTVTCAAQRLMSTRGAAPGEGTSITPACAHIHLCFACICWSVASASIRFLRGGPHSHGQQAKSRGWQEAPAAGRVDRERTKRSGQCRSGLGAMYTPLLLLQLRLELCNLQAEGAGGLR
jgi:hypothetical protein